MTAIDLDDFVAWLHAHGVPDAHLPLYREGAHAVVRQIEDDDGEVREVHIEAAVQDALARGATPRRIENLRSIGARLQLFADERRADEYEAAAREGEGDGEGEGEVDDGPALELADVPRGDSRRARLARISQGHGAVADGAVRGTMIDDLAAPAEGEAAAAPVAADPSDAPPAMAPRSALSPTQPPPSRPSVSMPAVPFTDGPRPGVLASATRVRSQVEEKPLPGCACRVRQEVYADDYWSMWGKVYLFVAGTFGLFMSMFWNRTTSLAISFAVGAIGALATAATAGWRCTDCRRWIERKGLDAEQVRFTRQRSLIFLAIGVALSIGSVVMVQRVRRQLAEEREQMKVLDDLKDLDETGD